MSRYKVHLMGGEGTGWALDADMERTHESLSALNDLVEFTSLEQADVIHCVWEWPLLHLPDEMLAGKKIICHVCNDLTKTYEQSCMIHADRVGIWVAMSHRCETQLTKLKHRNFYIPQAVDLHTFTRKKDQKVGIDGRKKIGIPPDRFVISNFMRDTFAKNLHVPKDQKGVELFFEIAHTLHLKGLPIHILLAGPRRHWIRNRLRENGIPFTFVGEELKGDDNAINVLAPATINALYHASDLHLVTSRWEGGPRAVLEAAATRTPLLSTPVGLAADVLEPDSLFQVVDEGIERIEQHIRENILEQTLEPQLQRVLHNHVPAANIGRFEAVYKQLENIPPYKLLQKQVAKSRKVRTESGRVMRWLHRNRPGSGLRISLWHEFHKPPYGGGNQFMMALGHALSKLGVRVEKNRLSKKVHAHLCNSAWFAVDDFVDAARSTDFRMVHRVDGPIAVYRGTDWKEDQKIYDLNTRLASATVYQSGWCLMRLHELGFHPKSPVVIPNAVDSRVFHSAGRVPYSPDRKIKLISTAWSDNPKKGGPFYKWLESKLDWDRFEYTFVGRTKETFQYINHIKPQPSKALAQILRQHDIYIMASEHEACSNALLEALSCGLPVLYLDDGANGELTRLGGLPFKQKEEALSQLDRIASNVNMFRRCIHVQSIEEIAGKYIELFKTVLDS
ncbi:MAG: glycosyltransferase [Candidatus Electrothrix sp. ATG1]|nr:glycosyltransferase [Candidatus Electrothrix sp. ATG1]